MTRVRLDQLLVTGGHAESREKAQRLIRAGVVRVDGQVKTKPGHSFPDDVAIAVEQPEPFVSRGGKKLQEAFDRFPLEVKGLVCMDIGASTGGFTDCMLQHGALRVYAIDVGKGQLHWDLRNDERVVVMEKFNARHLEPSNLPEQPAFASIDVSFISLTRILPPVTQVLAAGGHVVALIKPQFEAGREHVEKGGVVRDPETRRQVVERIRAFGEAEAGLEWIDAVPSPIKGPAGNVEFLSYWKKP
jgi:23S rRNA (cytidine1920-2'-O)/16S rRNA (cytidine1409-2'-O)-methyltransferase